MYYNQKNINLINKVKTMAEQKGLVFAQTSSRRNGHYLDACRIYRNLADKGKPRLAIWTGRTEKDFEEAKIANL